MLTVLLWAFFVAPVLGLDTVRLGYAVDLYYQESAHTSPRNASISYFDSPYQVKTHLAYLEAGNFTVFLFDELMDGGISFVAQDLRTFDILVETDILDTFAQREVAFEVPDVSPQPPVERCQIQEGEDTHPMEMKVTTDGWTAGVTFNYYQRANRCYLFSAPQPFELALDTWIQTIEIPLGRWELIVQNVGSSDVNFWLEDDDWAIVLAEFDVEAGGEETVNIDVGGLPPNSYLIHFTSECDVPDTQFFVGVAGVFTFTSEHSEHIFQKSCSNILDVDEFVLYEGDWTVTFEALGGYEGRVVTATSAHADGSDVYLHAAYHEGVNVVKDRFPVGDPSNFTFTEISVRCDMYPSEASFDVFVSTATGWLSKSAQPVAFSRVNQTKTTQMMLHDGIWQLVRYDSYGDGGTWGAVKVISPGHRPVAYHLEDIPGKFLYDVFTINVNASDVVVTIACETDSEETLWNLEMLDFSCFFEGRMSFFDYLQTLEYTVDLAAGTWRLVRYDQLGDGGIDCVIRRGTDVLLQVGGDVYSLAMDDFVVEYDTTVAIELTVDVFFTECSWNLVLVQEFNYFSSDRPCKPDSLVFNTTTLLADGNYGFRRSDVLATGGMGGRLSLVNTGKVLLDLPPDDYTDASVVRFSLGSGTASRSPVTFIVRMMGSTPYSCYWSFVHESGHAAFEETTQDILTAETFWLEHGNWKLSLFNTSDACYFLEVRLTDQISGDKLLTLSNHRPSGRDPEEYDVYLTSYVLPECLTEDYAFQEPECGDTLLSDGRPLIEFIIDASAPTLYKSWNIRDASGSNVFSTNREIDPGKSSDVVYQYLVPGEYTLLRYNPWNDGEMWAMVTELSSHSTLVDYAESTGFETHDVFVVSDDGQDRVILSVECPYEETELTLHVLNAGDVSAFFSGDSLDGSDCVIFYTCNDSFSVVPRQFVVPEASFLILENPNLSSVRINLQDIYETTLLTLPPELTSTNSKFVIDPFHWMEAYQNSSRLFSTPSSRSSSRSPLGSLTYDEETSLTNDEKTSLADDDETSVLLQWRSKQSDAHLHTSVRDPHPRSSRKLQLEASVETTLPPVEGYTGPDPRGWYMIDVWCESIYPDETVKLAVYQLQPVLVTDPILEVSCEVGQPVSSQVYFTPRGIVKPYSGDPLFQLRIDGNVVVVDVVETMFGEIMYSYNGFDSISTKPTTHFMNFVSESPQHWLVVESSHGNAIFSVLRYNGANDWTAVERDVSFVDEGHKVPYSDSNMSWSVELSLDIGEYMVVLSEESPTLDDAAFQIWDGTLGARVDVFSSTFPSSSNETEPFWLGVPVDPKVRRGRSLARVNVICSSCNVVLFSVYFDSDNFESKETTEVTTYMASAVEETITQTNIDEGGGFGSGGGGSGSGSSGDGGGDDDGDDGGGDDDNGSQSNEMRTELLAMFPGVSSYSFVIPVEDGHHLIKISPISATDAVSSATFTDVETGSEWASFQKRDMKEVFMIGTPSAGDPVVLTWVVTCPACTEISMLYGDMDGNYYQTYRFVDMTLVRGYYERNFCLPAGLWDIVLKDYGVGGGVDLMMTSPEWEGVLLSLMLGETEDVTSGTLLVPAVEETSVDAVVRVKENAVPVYFLVSYYDEDDMTFVSLTEDFIYAEQGFDFNTVLSSNVWYFEWYCDDVSRTLSAGDIQVVLVDTEEVVVSSREGHAGDDTFSIGVPRSLMTLWASCVSTRVTDVPFVWLSELICVGGVINGSQCDSNRWEWRRVMQFMCGSKETLVMRHGWYQVIRDHNAVNGGLYFTVQDPVSTEWIVSLPASDAESDTASAPLKVTTDYFTIGDVVVPDLLDNPDCHWTTLTVGGGSSSSSDLPDPLTGVTIPGVSLFWQLRHFTNDTIFGRGWVLNNQLIRKYTCLKTDAWQLYLKHGDESPYHNIERDISNATLVDITTGATVVSFSAEERLWSEERLDFVLGNKSVFLTRVLHGQDDAQELLYSGVVTRETTNLELARSYDVESRPENVVGLRFGSIFIPKGSIVTSAFIELQLASTTGRDGHFIISGDYTPWSLLWVDTRGTLSARALTPSSVQWQTNVMGISGNATADDNFTYGGVQSALLLRTADLSSILQDLVTLPGWSLGTAVSFLFEGDGLLDIKSYEADDFEVPSTATAPRLYIEYKEADESPSTLEPSPDVSASASASASTLSSTPSPPLEPEDASPSPAVDSVDEGGAYCGALCQNDMQACWQGNSFTSVLVTTSETTDTSGCEPFSLSQEGECLDLRPSIRNPCGLQAAVDTVLAASVESGASLVSVVVSVDVTPEIVLTKRVVIEREASSTVLVLQSYDYEESTGSLYNTTSQEDLTDVLVRLPKIIGSGDNGLLDIRGGMVQIMGLAFVGGFSDYGGAVSISSPADVDFGGCLFIYSHARIDGGVLSTCDDSAVSISGCLFKLNGVYDADDAESTHSIAYIRGAAVIKGSKFDSNSGAAVGFVGRMSHRVDETTVSGHVGKNGGAIVVSEDSGVNIVRSLFYSNMADLGGALYVQGEVTLLQCNFWSNSARYGGVMYLEPRSKAYVDTTRFSSNRAYSGGALYASGGTYLLSDSFVKNNSAVVDYRSRDWAQMGTGGALFDACELGCTSEIADVVFEENYAEADANTEVLMTSRPIRIINGTTTQKILPEMYMQCESNPCGRDEACIDLMEREGYAGILCECRSKVECSPTNLDTCPSEQSMVVVSKSYSDGIIQSDSLLFIWSGCGQVEWTASSSSSWLYLPVAAGNLTQHSCEEADLQYTELVDFYLLLEGMSVDGVYESQLTISYDVSSPTTLEYARHELLFTYQMVLSVVVSSNHTSVDVIVTCLSPHENCQNFTSANGRREIYDEETMTVYVTARDMESLQIDNDEAVLRVYIGSSLATVMVYGDGGVYSANLLSPSRDFSLSVLLASGESEEHILGSPMSFNVTCREGTTYHTTTKSCEKRAEETAKEERSVMILIAVMCVALMGVAAVMVWKYGRDMRDMLIKLFQETFVLAFTLFAEVCDIVTDVLAWLAVRKDDTLTEFHIPYTVLIVVALSASAMAVGTSFYTLYHIIHSTKELGSNMNSYRNVNSISGKFVRWNSKRRSGDKSATPDMSVSLTSNLGKNKGELANVGKAGLVSRYGVAEAVMLGSLSDAAGPSATLSAACYKVHRTLYRKFAKIVMLIFEDFPMLIINVMIEFKNDTSTEVDLQARRMIRLSLIFTGMLIGTKVASISAVPGLYRLLRDLKNQERKQKAASSGLYSTQDSSQGSPGRRFTESLKDILPKRRHPQSEAGYVEMGDVPFRPSSPSFDAGTRKEILTDTGSPPCTPPMSPVTIRSQSPRNTEGGGPVFARKMSPKIPNKGGVACGSLNGGNLSHLTLRDGGAAARKKQRSMRRNQASSDEGV